MSSENDDNTQDSAVDAVAAKTQETMGDVTDKVANAVDAAAGTTQSLLSAGGDQVAAGMRKTADAIHDVRSEALDTARGHPLRTVLVVAAVAAIVGFVIGMARNR